jgi:hypothetical protein
MSKIYFEGKLIWIKPRLPNEREAMKLLSIYGGQEVKSEAAVALSCGIEVHTKNGIFTVELSSDRRFVNVRR